MVGKSELIIVWQKEPTVPLQESTWDETEVLDGTVDEDIEAEAEVVVDMAETEADLEIDTPDETVDDRGALFIGHLVILDDQLVHTEGTTDIDKTIKTVCKKIKWAELDTMFLNLKIIIILLFK